MVSADPLLQEEGKVPELPPDVHPVFNLNVEIELKLMKWDGNHPPFCRAWLADDFAQEMSKPVKLQEKKDERKGHDAGAATVVMEHAVIEVHKGYRYLLIDFHKQFHRTNVPNADDNSFQPELGQLKINLNDVLQVACENKLEDNEFIVKFCRDGIPIHGVIRVRAQWPNDVTPTDQQRTDLFKTMVADDGMTEFHKTLNDLQNRKEWLDDIKGVTCFGPDSRFRRFWARSQQIGEEGVNALPHERWMRGKLDNLVAGPALALALRSLIGVLFAYTMFAYLFGEILLPSCVTLGERQIAMVPNIAYLLFLLFGLWKLNQEMLMMAAVLPLRVMVEGFPKYRIALTLKGYLLFKIFNSFLASFEIFSASLFLARIRATRVLEQYDPRYWNMESAWHFALRESESLSSLFDWLGWYPTFLQLASLSWMTFFLQVLYSLAYSIPSSWEIQSSSRPSQAVAYDFREAKDMSFKMTENGELVQKHTWGDEVPTQSQNQPWLRRMSMDGSDKKNNGEAQPGKTSNTTNRHSLLGLFCVPCTTACLMLQTIARLFVTESKTGLVHSKKEEGNQQWVAFSDYATYSTMLCEEQTHGQALAAVAKTGRLTLAQAMEPEYAKGALEQWRPHEILQAQRQQNQAFMVFMIQKLFNISMQASLVGISANLSAVAGNTAGADRLTVFTVLLSCMLSVGSVLTQIFSSTAMKNRVVDGAEKKLKAEGATKWQQHHEYVVERRARWEWTVTILFSTWCFALLLWCTVKTVMAWYCDCGMWNFTKNILPWNLPYSWGDQTLLGCVRFHSQPGSDDTGCSVTEDHLRSLFHPSDVNFTNISASFDCSWLVR